MNLPPKPPRFGLPVAGTKVGSLARPIADSSAAKPIAPARFGLRSNTRTLASLSRQESRLPGSRQESRLPGARPAVTPDGSLTSLDLPDGEVA